MTRRDEPIDLDGPTVDRLREICLALPEVVEEQAWVGLRWRVRGRTFSHVLVVASGWPPAYARLVDRDEPLHLLMFRSAEPELTVLRESGAPFLAPPWRADEVGLVLDPATDWPEVAELLTDSYCRMAPAALRSTVTRPPAL